MGLGGLQNSSRVGYAVMVKEEKEEAIVPHFLVDVASLMEMEMALKAIVANAPVESPERYEGDNHGDTARWASDSTHYELANLARPALEKIKEIIGKGSIIELKEVVRDSDEIVDRSDAVNLARNIKSDNLEITKKGINCLVDAVLLMDEALKD